MAGKDTRIQREKRKIIMDAALEAFSNNGFRGTTLDEIADLAGLSKPNMLYYFAGKEVIYTALLNDQLDMWTESLRSLSADGQPREEIMKYIRGKMQMSRDNPRQSRLFANEMLTGAQRISRKLSEPMSDLVNEKVAVIQGWIDDGKLAKVDPYHLLFSIWATTQHYADFAVQIDAVVGRRDSDPITTGTEYLEGLFFRGLAPE